MKELLSWLLELLVLRKYRTATLLVPGRLRVWGPVREEGKGPRLHLQGVLHENGRCREERGQGSGVREQSCSVQKQWQINLVLPLICVISEPLSPAKWESESTQQK